MIRYKFLLALIFFLFQPVFAAGLEKVYKVGLPYVPGLMFRDENGNPKGLPLEITAKALNDAGIKFEWVDGSWPELFEKTKKGLIDVLPGTQKSPERYEYLDFLENDLYLIWSEVYIHKETDYYHIQDFRNKLLGFVINDNNATGFEEYIKDFHIPFQKVYFESHREAINALKNKEIFGFPGPNPNILDDFLGEDIKRSGLFFNPTKLSISFPKGKNSKLRGILDQKILQYKNDPNSLYNQLINSYRVSHISPNKPFMPYWLIYTLAGAIFLSLTGFAFIILMRSEVKRKTMELNEQNELLKRTMDIGKMGSWTYDINSNHVEWPNEVKSLDLFDTDKNKMQLDKMFEYVHFNDRQKVKEEIKNALEYILPLDIEIRFNHQSGKVIYTRNYGIIEINKDRKPAKITGITQDITEQKKYEKELIEAKQKAQESERLKSAFLANMSHEIRTPLNAIVGFSRILCDEQTEKDEMAEYSAIIRKQTDLLLTIINDIVDIAKIESGNIKINIDKNVDLNNLIDDIYKSFSTSIPPSIDFRKECKLSNIKIETDNSRFKQIIINFLTNAIKHTGKGSVILGCSENPASGIIKVFVKDTGKGISDNEIDKIFDRFYKINEYKQGAGLGLFISKSLAELLGLKIGVNSELGKGAEFYLEIPYFSNSGSGNSNKKKDLISVLPRNKSSKILIAEDDMPNFLLLEKILTKNNYSVTHAENGIEAIQQLQKNKFDLVLMDIKMPEMGGLEAVENIRQFNKNIPIIAVTAYAMNSDEMTTLQAGCDGYISKPFDEDKLLTTIYEFLNNEV